MVRRMKWTRSAFGDDCTTVKRNTCSTLYVPFPLKTESTNNYWYHGRLLTRAMNDELKKPPSVSLMYVTSARPWWSRRNRARVIPTSLTRRRRRRTADAPARR